MNTDQILDFFLGQGIINLLFKSFAVLISILYFVYALIVMRQTAVMNRTVQTRGRTLFNFISLLQLIFSMILILLAFILV